MQTLKLFLEIQSISTLAYWEYALQNAIGCALGSIAAIAITIWIYRSQYKDNENNKQKATLEIQNNTLKYFSVSIKDILDLLNHQHQNIEKFISDFKGDVLEFPMMTYVPLFPIKRIVENTSLDKILISYIDKFSESENVIKEFSELISLLDYLYLELASLPELLQRGQMFDHERQKEFGDNYKKIWDIIGSLIAHDTGKDPIIAGYKKIIEDFIKNDIDVRDIKLYYTKIILPVNEYSIQLLTSGKITTEFEQLAILTRDSKQVYNDIIKHNNDFIQNDISAISKNIYEAFIKLQNQTKNLVELIKDKVDEKKEGTVKPDQYTLIVEEKDTNSQKKYNPNFMKKFTIRIEIMVAFLAFIGSLGGVYISNIYSKNQWQREKNFQLRQTVLNKRVELLERTLTVFNQKSNEYSMLKDEFKVIIETMQLKLAATQEKFKKSGKSKLDDIINFEPDELYKKAYDNRKKQIEISNEIVVVISLDGLYFGHKTNQLVDSIEKHFPNLVDIDSTTKVHFLTTLYSDLNSDLP